MRALRAVGGHLALVLLAFGCREKAPAPGTSAPGTSAPGTSAPSTSTSSVPAPSAAEGPKTYVIGMSQCNLGEPWRVQMNADVAAAAAKHPNLKLVMKDAQNDSLRQRAQVEELAAQKIDLLIISPKEA